jgi:hypothetical protein
MGVGRDLRARLKGARNEARASVLSDNKRQSVALNTGHSTG